MGSYFRRIGVLAAAGAALLAAAGRVLRQLHRDAERPRAAPGATAYGKRRASCHGRFLPVCGGGLSALSCAKVSCPSGGCELRWEGGV